MRGMINPSCGSLYRSQWGCLTRCSIIGQLSRAYGVAGAFSTGAVPSLGVCVLVCGVFLRVRTSASGK